MLLENATWQEIDRLDRSTVVVAPFGAMEQHGPHLPVQTDSLIAAAIAQRVDEALGGKLLIMPVLWAGYSPHHMDFAGSITVSASSFIQNAVEMVGSLAHSGFSRFLLLNAHGGNRAALDIAASELRFRHPDAMFASATYWSVAARELAKLRESDSGGMGHACELETSIVLALAPELVRIELARADGAWPCSEFLGHDMLESGCAGLALSFAELTKTGTNGDPTSATAVKGEAFLSAIVRRLSDLIRQMQSGEFARLKRVQAAAELEKA